jgi:membrane protein
LAILRQTYLEWQADQVPTQAAALAYYTIFALAPLLVVILAVAGLFTSADAARERLLQEISGLVGAGGAEWIGEVLERASSNQSSGVLGVVLGVGGLILGASGAFGQLQQTLNTIWDAKPPAKLSAIVRARAMSFGVVLVMGFLLLVSLVVSAGLSALEAQLGLADAVWLWRGVYEVFSVVIVGVLFAVIYTFLPDKPVPWRDALVGGVFTAVLFTVGKTLIGLYLGYSASQSVFGAAGALAVLLLWIYYAAQIVLFGAEFTQVYSVARSGQPFKGAQNAPEPASAIKDAALLEAATTVREPAERLAEDPGLRPWLRGATAVLTVAAVWLAVGSRRPRQARPVNRAALAREAVRGLGLGSTLFEQFKRGRR